MFPAGVLCCVCFLLIVPLGGEALPVSFPMTRCIVVVQFDLTPVAVLYVSLQKN